MEKELFEKYYYVLGNIVMLESFGNKEHHLEILELDLFVKFYYYLGRSKIMKSFGQKCKFDQ